MKNKQAYLMEVEDQVQLTDLEKKYKLLNYQ
jgi:hypothetical protein